MGKIELIGKKGFSFRYLWPLIEWNQLKYPMHQPTFFILFTSVMRKCIQTNSRKNPKILSLTVLTFFSYHLGNHKIEKVVFTRLRLGTSIFYTVKTTTLLEGHNPNYSILSQPNYFILSQVPAPTISYWHNPNCQNHTRFALSQSKLLYCHNHNFLKIVTTQTTLYCHNSN